MKKSSFYIFLLILFSSPWLGAQAKTAVQWQKEGEEALLRRDYYKAVDNFTEALEQNSSYIDSYKGLMQAYISLSQAEKAFFYAQKALPLSLGDLDFYVMYGNLLVTRGEYTEAKSYFDRVLKIQENNKDALLGIARLYRAQNNLILAGRYYNLLFSLYPNNPNLPAGEMVILLAQQGKEQEAINFIRRVENAYQASPEFALLVSQFYFNRGDYKQAEHYGEHFLVLSEKLGFNDLIIKAHEQLGQISLQKGDSLKAIEIFKQALVLKRNDTILNYLLGVAYLKEGDLSTAQDYFYRALEESKGQEVYQEALEATFFMPESSLNNPYRSRLASNYARRAEELSRVYLYEQALSYAEQAKAIDPQNNKTRLLLANLYRSLGYPILSLRELSFLKNERKYESDELENLLEISLLGFMKSPLYLWGFTDTASFNRLLAERNQSRIALFYTKKSDLQDSYQFLLSSLGRSLGRISFIKVDNQSIREGQIIPYYVSRISEAFRLARENNLDYYILLTPLSTAGGGFSLKAEIFLAKTATKVKEIMVARFNDQSRSTAIEQLSREIALFLPIKGSFIKREGNRALINLGKMDKLTQKTQLAVVRPEDLSYSEETGAYSYDSKKIVGIAHIEKLDDFVSEVNLEKQGLVDIIDINCWLIPLP